MLLDTSNVVLPKEADAIPVPEKSVASAKELQQHLFMKEVLKQVVRCEGRSLPSAKAMDKIMQEVGNTILRDVPDLPRDFFKPANTRMQFNNYKIIWNDCKKQLAAENSKLTPRDRATHLRYSYFGPFYDLIDAQLARRSDTAAKVAANAPPVAVLSRIATQSDSGLERSSEDRKSVV